MHLMVYGNWKFTQDQFAEVPFPAPWKFQVGAGLTCVAGRASLAPPSGILQAALGMHFPIHCLHSSPLAAAAARCISLTASPLT